MTKLIKRFPYWYWPAGAGVVWAILLLITSQTLSPVRFHRLLIFFAGFAFGVLGANIARKVYK